MHESSAPFKPVWLNILFLTATPLAALILVPWHLWTHGITVAEVVTFGVLWLLTGLGVTAGYHRLFSHRAYKASAPVRLLFAIFGAASWQNSIIAWCAAHRFHHRHVDTDQDPYNAQRGFFWSHIGWIFVEGPQHQRYDNVADLWDDPICRWQHTYHFAIGAAVNVGIPVIVGLAVGNVLGLLIIAGLCRVVILHHTTFCINSVAHFFGTQPWGRDNSSRDNWLLSLITFGEGYHNYHHAFQRDYRNGPFWYNWDPSKWTIWGLGHVGLAEDLMSTPADVVLRHRFEDRRKSYGRWRAEIAERVEAWSERWRSDSQDVRVSLRQQVEQAQRRLEESLKELTDARKRWATSRKQHRAERLARTRREMKALKRAFRIHIREAKASLAQWEALVANYTRMESAAMAAAA